MLGVVLAASGAQGAPPPSAAGVAAGDATNERARVAFLRGVAEAKSEQWSEALAAFEEATKLRDLPLARFNVGYCQRALGRYVAARETLLRVLAEPTGLSAMQVDEARAYVSEIEPLLVQIDVALDPPAAALTVDGRPLQRATQGGPAGREVFLVSVAAPSGPESIGRAAFTLVADPGVHLVRAVRAGHRDAIVQRSFRPGERARLDLHLDSLPATVAVRSEPPQAIVRVDDREVGLAPIDVERPAGSYSIRVEHEGFEPHTARFALSAGERADLTASLVPEKHPITKTWWFWTAAGLVVSGAATATYLLTRTTPDPPPYDGGSTGWVARPAALHF